METKCDFCLFFGEKAHCNNCKLFAISQQQRLPKEINCSDEEFIEYINHPDDSNALITGDYKFIETNYGERLKAIILDSNRELLANVNGLARITLGVLKMDGAFEMNPTSTNITSWEKSKMRQVYMPRVFSSLPKIYQDNIKPVVKSTSAGNASRDIIKTVDKLFLFSESEVFGRNMYSHSGEGSQYEYFENDKVKFFDRYTWLRSPCYDYGKYFCGVDSSGSADCNYADNCCGLAFGFCL